MLSELEHFPRCPTSDNREHGVWNSRAYPRPDMVHEPPYAVDVRMMSKTADEEEFAISMALRARADRVHVRKDEHGSHALTPQDLRIGIRDREHGVHRAIHGELPPARFFGLR